MRRIRLLAGDLTQTAGSSLYCEELAVRLASRGHAVSVICYRATERVRKTCDIVEIGRSPIRNCRGIWRFAHHLDEIHCGRALRNARLDATDVVIGLEHLFIREYRRFFAESPLVYVPLSLIAPMEIASYRLGGICGFASKLLFAKIQKWALRHAEVTVRFNEMSCQLLDSYYYRGRSNSRRYVVNRIPVTLPQRFARPDLDHPVRLLTVGRLTESKNVEFALRKLFELRDYNWQFDVVGTGETLGRLQDLVRQFQLDDRVVFHGRIPETESAFLSADLFLFTSRLDNSPLAVLEAMSYHIPVLGVQPDGVCYSTGIAEVVEHGRTGLLAPCEDMFTLQLQWALEHRSELRRMGDAARRFVEQHHTWEKHLDRYEMLFDELTLPKHPTDRLPIQLA